jgi:hypothetical protein
MNAMWHEQHVMPQRAMLEQRIARERAAELVEAGAGGYFDPGRGRLMKEWLGTRAASPKKARAS